MILSEFSKYLQSNEGKSSVVLLNEWLLERLTKPSLNKVDNIIKAELYLARNNSGKTLIIGKSDTGRTLMKALYNYALSYEQYKFAKFLHDKKASDVKKKD